MRVIIKILHYLFIFILLLLTLSTNWAIKNFKNISIEQIIFHLQAPLHGTDSNMIFSYIYDSLIPSIILIVIFIIIDFIMNNVRLKINIKNLKKDFKIYPRAIITVLVTMVLCILIHDKVNALGIPKYVNNLRVNSNLYEDYYINPKQAEIVEPETKRNLIYIFLESMETTYLSKELGGAQQENLIPNITKLAGENVSFSSSDVFNGAYPIPGTQWTIAALLAQTAGIPLNLPINGNEYSGYGQFLPGAYSLGDVLKSYGYNQEFFIGSDAKFAGREDYFLSHGNYIINDYNAAIKNGLIAEDYKVWWGYEDKKLFEFAKDEILKLSNEDNPFNFTMLTVDTHHVSGYVCDLCENEFDNQYSNVIACSDRQVSEFVEWIQQQDFYENTTIIISGDHNSMDPNFFNNLPSDYQRSTFNVIINSPIKPKNEKNRLFTSLDMYPTTMVSLGFKIEKDRLGLGTNLFSEEKTLIEELGKDSFSLEIEKNSKYYNQNILYK